MGNNRMNPNDSYDWIINIPIYIIGFPIFLLIFLFKLLLTPYAIGWKIYKWAWSDKQI
jgi:hypothetical protein